MGLLRSADVQKLLHNKFVVILGDSIQRCVYKDLVKFLRGDELLSCDQVKERGEKTFEEDTLIEGGKRDGLHNGTNFREVRQYRTGHHLVRFYFLTRVYSTYLESILSDFRSGPQPDVLIVNSCIWDINRYNDHNQEAYKTNLDLLFQRLKKQLNPRCLMLWTMTMPVGYRDNEKPEELVYNLQPHVMAGNFFSATLANFHQLDVLDMHYHFRCALTQRWVDGVHWNQVVHRMYTQILLAHIAEAWGVKMPKAKRLKGPLVPLMPPHLVSARSDPYPRPLLPMQGHFSFVNDVSLLTGSMGPGYFTPPGFAFPNDPPHPAAMREDPCPRSLHPMIFEQDPSIQGSMAPDVPPHPAAMREDPYPRPYPMIQGREHNIPGPVVPPAPPLLITPRPEPYSHPPLLIHEEERYIQADSPFVRDDPLLAANIGPDYFPPPPGHPFAERNFLFPPMPQQMNFPPFPSFPPYQQEAFNRKMMSSRVLKPRRGLINAYP